MRPVACSFSLSVVMPHFRLVPSFFSSLFRTPSAQPKTESQAATKDSLTQDAFSIADRSMIEILRAQCICQDAEGMRLWPVDTTGMKVKAVAQACPQILRALEWCRRRDMAHVETNAWDELIVLKAQAA